MSPTSTAPAPPTAGSRPAADPGVLDALTLLLEVTDELVVRSVRDTHRAVAARVGALVRATTLGAGGGPVRAHDLVAEGVYGAIGRSLRGAARGTGALAARGTGPGLDERGVGRQLRAAVNGLIGDRLDTERRALAIRMAPRVGGRDVEVTRTGLAAAYPAATPRVAIFLHGLGESDEVWRLGRAERGSTYPEDLEAAGWTPVVLRMNSGLGLRPNGVALASLLDRLVTAWPTDVERIALVGHSMGGLVMRAAAAVVPTVDAGGHAAGERPWVARVSDVVTLGTPHRGAPLAALVGRGSSLLGVLEESAAFGRILDERSVGVRDLVEGLGHDVPPLPHARYRLVSGTVSRSPRHPVGAVLGDLLVREASAYGRRGRSWDDLFADVEAETLHVGGAGHFALLNHPEVADRLLRWLS
ncbi:alpha/beta hydrolase [Nocardioides zeae]|uniref:Alpha/beta hydrolase n=1 Tax=Nocardioides zeae TaxID=1457234 RepID=A0A6P0HQ51_9ACTN|nr:alpha/beta hydrolase [Nocardioides zeae]